MDKRILKSALVITLSGIASLVFPIFGQWYYQKTGMIPFGLYFIFGMGGIVLSITVLRKIWGDLK